MRHAPLALAGALVAVALLPSDANARRWGEAGHRLVARAASAHVPKEMPTFFRNAGPQLAYLNPEPDRWRVHDSAALDPAMDRAYSPEHFVDLEMLPEGALDARDRHAYAERLARADVSAARAGFLPYRILELTERLRTEFRLWRRAPNARVRGWIEQRIINDAGILGHYVADAANPHHTTIHYNGWVGDNPNGFATDRGFHSRFESAFVQEKIRFEDVEPLVLRAPRTHEQLRRAIRAFIQDSNDHVVELYELDKAEAFGPRTESEAHRRFTARRLAVGATMLRDLWWTAWVTSEMEEEAAEDSTPTPPAP